MRTLLAVALTSHLLPEYPPLGPKAWRALRAAVELCESPDELRPAAEALGEDVADKVEERLGRLDDYEEALSKLAAQSIVAVSEFDPGYPVRWRARLSERAPPLVFCSGGLGILNTDSIGVVGSREVDDAGKKFAEQVAMEAAGHGMALVSGGARGVDRDSMRAALQENGEVLGVLAESLRRAIRDPSAADRLESGRLCLCTPYSPDAPFSAGNAMGRNKLIYAQAIATVVVSSDLGVGGTWAGASEALRLGIGPVLVRSGPDAPQGNRALIEKGCAALDDPAQLWDAIASAGPAQQGLF